VTDWALVRFLTLDSSSKKGEHIKSVKNIPQKIISLLFLSKLHACILRAILKLHCDTRFQLAITACDSIFKVNYFGLRQPV